MQKHTNGNQQMQINDMTVLKNMEGESIFLESDNFLIHMLNTSPYKPKDKDLNDPLWKKGSHPLLMGLVERAQNELRYKCAPHPSHNDKLRTCSHEAAHATVMGADGCSIKEVLAWADFQGWAGVVLHNPPFHMPSQSTNPDLWLMRKAVYLLSGYAGEIFSGYEHPMSALTERVSAMGICLFLDEKFGKEQGYLYRRAMSYCQTVLEANREAFDAIFAELIHEGRVTGKQAKRILKKPSARAQLSLEVFTTESGLLQHNNEWPRTSQKTQSSLTQEI